MWSKENEVNLRVKVDKEGMLSRIAKIKAKMEELEHEVDGLLNCMETEETSVSGNTEA